ALEGEERASLEKHLDGCSGCRQELEALRGDTALLAVGTAGPMPPQRSRQRLLIAIAKEPRLPAALPAPAPRFNFWALFGWAAAVGMLVVVIQLRRQNASLQQAM